MASSNALNEQQQLHIGQYFFTWDSAIAYVQNWCNVQGFQMRLSRSKRNADGQYQKLTIICQHAGNRKPLTDIQLNNRKSSKEKVSKSIQMGCKAHINLSRPEKNNVNQYVFITTISNEHCHELNCELVNYENEVKMTEEMLKDIEFLTKYVNLSTTQQRVYLEKKYPNQKIRSDILRKEIQKHRPSTKDLSNDASKLYEHLIQLKESDVRWQIFVEFDEAKVLRRLFWMSPNQVELWIQYYDFVINDITYKTNRYDMALSLFVIIDNHNCSRLVCQALVDDETAEAHIWILECTLLATGGRRQNENVSGGLIPLVFMTDSDPAVDAACIRIYKGCYAMHCVYHINQNLHKNLSGPLGENYSQFLSEFYNARNSLSQERFEHLFLELIKKYEQISNYLNRLYKFKVYWAFCYTSTIFTAATQTTSRVEGLNAVLKRELINSNTSLVQLNKTIHRRHQEEEQQKEYAFWKSVIPCVISPQTANFLFPAVQAMIKGYLTDPLYDLQVQEINQSVYYKCECLDFNQVNILEQVCKIFLLVLLLTKISILLEFINFVYLRRRILDF
jgi:hypothetical protein